MTGVKDWPGTPPEEPEPLPDFEKDLAVNHMNHREAENPKFENNSPISSELQQITYHYLTFDTDLPARAVLPNGISRDLPPRPNLQKFQNPFEWPRARKNIVTWIACSVNITAAYAAGSYASPAAVLTKKWGISNVVYNVGITVFTAGFGTAPMVLAPFSEINGRRPVFVATGLLFVVCQLCCALTPSFGGMLAARFVLGCAGSTFSTMVGGILADIWQTSERNTPMTLFTGATLFGTGLGPLVSGFVVQYLEWRWVFYLQVISSGSLVTLVILFFKETRGSILLSRKAKALNKWYEQLEDAGCVGMEMPSFGEKQPQRVRWKVKADEDRVSLGKMIAVSLYRPIHMLVTESVVFWFSLWISFSWAVLYLQFGALPLVYETRYNFTLEQTGAVFAAICVGGIISTVLSIYQEKVAVRYCADKFTSSPEGRLYFTCVEAALMPIGIFWFGWTAFSDIHWIVPTIAVSAITMGIFSIYLAVFNYSADVYHIYASSSLAASGLCRNFLGGSFPLVTVQMFKGLGFPAASSLLGGIGAVLTLVPWVLVFFGPKIRARSKIASQFMH
jgi:multidrug resistance protein